MLKKYYEPEDINAKTEERNATVDHNAVAIVYRPTRGWGNRDRQTAQQN